MLDQKRSIWSWAMYDWANSAFATTVMAGFFPIFFGAYWSAGVSNVDTTARLGFANSIASIIVALIAPFLGSIADKGTAKKKFLFTFAFLGIVMTGALFMVQQGQWQIAAFMYIVATIGFSGGNIFYDSLLPGVASEKKIDHVSSLGFAMGYIGGGILFLVNVVMYLMPTLFGLPVESEVNIDNFIYNGSSNIIQLNSNENFNIPEDFNSGNASINCKYKVAVNEYKELNENEVKLLLQVPDEFDWDILDDEISKIDHKEIEILGRIPDEGAIIINKNKFSGIQDSIFLHQSRDFVYSEYKDSTLIGVSGLNNLKGNVSIITNYLEPSQEQLPVRLSFLSVAIWWALFSIPVFLFVKEPKYGNKKLNMGAAIVAGWKQFIGTFKEIRHLKVVAIFLLAYWFYIDGVDTIIRMAISIGTALEFPAASLIVALLIVQFVAFGGSLLYSVLARKIGAKPSLYIGIAGYAVITMVGFFMNQVWHFYALAVAIGLFQGGIQAISRSLYSRIIPINKSAEFYGFFNLLGKFAAVIGPSLMGVIALLTKNAKELTIGSTTLENMGIRYGVLSILALFIIGGLLLRKVDIEEGKKQVQYLK